MMCQLKTKNTVHPPLGKFSLTTKDVDFCDFYQLMRESTALSVRMLYPGYLVEIIVVMGFVISTVCP